MNLKKIYEKAYLQWSKYPNFSRERLIMGSMNKLIATSNPEEIYSVLGNLYIDYALYSKKLNSGATKEFADYILTEENPAKNFSLGWAEENLKKRLQTPERNLLIKKCVAYKIVKENNLIEEFQEYVENKDKILNLMNNDDD